MKLPSRHELFYRMLDFSLILQVLWFAQVVFERVMGERLLHGQLRSAFIVLEVVSLLIPAVLIFARFMRDEFSQELWQKTAGTVLKGLIVLPIPVAFAVGMSILDDSNFSSKRLHEVIASGDAREALLMGVIHSMVSLWLLTPVLFTFAFQWHRWRANR